MCKSGHDLYERIYYPVDLPAITDLEETDCRYPVLFEPNRGRPKKEVRLTKPNASIQKCSRCNLSGVCLLSYLFLSLFWSNSLKDTIREDVLFLQIQCYCHLLLQQQIPRRSILLLFLQNVRCSCIWASITWCSLERIIRYSFQTIHPRNTLLKWLASFRRFLRMFERQRQLRYQLPFICFISEAFHPNTRMLLRIYSRIFV